MMDGSQDPSDGRSALDLADADFPIRASYAFFNHAGTSPLPRVAAEAVAGYASEFSRHGWMSRGRWNATLQSCRRLIAGKMGCEPSEIAFCANTTAGIGFAANGINWRPGDNVVLANVEYPANVYPWWAQQHRGVTLKFVQDRGGRLRLEDYFDAIDGRTRAVAVSHVQFATGCRIDLEALGEFCEKRGVLLVVDAIQSLGALPVNVRTARVAALACGSHKWLLSPLGLGIFYCRKDLCERLRVWAPGAESVVRKPGTYLDYRLDLREGAGRFEAGSLNLAAICGLEAVLRMMESIGEQRIERRIRSLTDHLCRGLQERGCELVSSRAEGEWSGIVVFSHPKCPARDVVDALARRQVIVALREGRVRVSPHFYNTEDEIERLLRAVDQLII